jgi:hypothetical protein
MLAACEATIRHLWDIAARFNTKECNLIRDEIHRLNTITLPAIQDLRAAAPVPCSPVDMIAFVEEKAAKARKDHAWRVEDAECWRSQSDDDQREAAALAQRMSGRKTATVPKAERDRLAQISDRIGAKRLAEAEMYEAILDRLRATGEGARDGHQQTIETPPPTTGEVWGKTTPSADSWAIGIGPSQAAAVAPRRDPSAEAPPIAVSLDPHRLLDDLVKTIEGFKDGTRLRTKSQRERIEVDTIHKTLNVVLAELARLRGEATVRVEE